MMNDDVQSAYQRGLHDGEVAAIRDLAERAHVRMDKIEPRVTALERVMYAGLGIVFLIELLPSIAEYMSQ